jgi:molybdopterin converting factor small subunit
MARENLAMGLAADSAPDQAAPPVDGTSPASVILLFFAAARTSAGTGREAVSGGTVAEVLDAARARYGPSFAAVLDASRVWVNGEPAPGEHMLHDGDEVAILPPVSGGAGPVDGTAVWCSPARTVP